MRKIISVVLVLIILLPLVHVSVSAAEGITVELVDYVSYIDIEDDNSVIIKLVNKTDEDVDIVLSTEITKASGTASSEESTYVLLKHNSVLHHSMPVKPAERGEYTLTVSAKTDGKVLAEFTRYLLADHKVIPHQNIGVCAHFDRGTLYRLSDMEAIKKTGFTMIRDECRWDDVELKKGEYKIPAHITEYINKANDAGVEVLLMLAFNNPLYSDAGGIPTTEDNINAFGEYVRFVVKELKGKVKYFEVWNEPNHESFNPTNATAAQYVELLKKAYEIIKHENPEAYVVSGGTAGSGPDIPDYIKEMVAAGVQNYIDGFGIHPYVCWTGAVVDERTGRDYASDITHLIDECGITKDIWITEVGYITQYPGNGEEDYYTEEEKGSYNVRTMVEFKADQRVKKLFLYQFKESDEYWENFQLINADNTAGEGYKIVRTMNYLLSNADFVKKWGALGDCAAYQFRDRTTGNDIFVMWTKDEKTMQLGVSAEQSEPHAVKTFVPFPAFGLKLDVGTSNADGILYYYDAYGNKTQIDVGTATTLDFKPAYIVCEKPKREDSCTVAMENGMITGQGYIAEASQYATVRAVKKHSRETVFVNQVTIDANGEFKFSFRIPGDDVYEIYVYNGIVNYEKINSGGVDVNFSVDVNGKAVNSIGQLNEKDVMNILATIENRDESLGDLKFIVAVYAEDDRLLFAKAETVTPGIGITKQVPVELMATGVDKWKNMKLFLWDAESLKSVVKNLEIKE